MVKLVKRVVGFKSRVEAQKYAKAHKGSIKRPRYGWNKKHKHFIEY